MSKNRQNAKQRTSQRGAHARKRAAQQAKRSPQQNSRGFSTDGYDLSGYDQDLVKQAQGGKKWDANDQARYDKLIAQRNGNQQQQTPKPAPVAQKPTPAAPPQMQQKPTPPQPQATPQPPKVTNTTTTNSDNNYKQEGQGIKPGGSMGSGQGQMAQNVNQDNDIETTITGDNNKVFNDQDNSIRQYGGDNRSFTYNAGPGKRGKYMQTPVSAATMSGFYAVDDSPAAQAKFTDLHSQLNADKQKRYAGDAFKVSQKYMTDARDYTPESMENYLNKHIQYSYDRADRQTGLTFGDIWNENYITKDWAMPDSPKPIESNAAEIADKAKEDIEDI